jgi:bifunctional non-homologous end joining protein LigD
MARPPRKPRPIARATRAEAPRVPGPVIAPPRADARQPDLFRPTFIEPCKPVLRERLPAGPLWRYEVKHDGYRIQAHAIGNEVRLYTRRGLDWTDRMPAIRNAVAALGRDVILDGEATIVGEDGIADFFALHAALARKHAPDAILFAFDVLRIDGDDMRQTPLVERQDALAALLVGSEEFGLEAVEPIEGDAEAITRAACSTGLEGVVAKRLDRPYRSGQREDWIKVRCTRLDHFAVTGFAPAGRRGVSSVKIAMLVDAQLVPCGWAGSGIGEEMSRALRFALDAGHYVVLEVEHRGMTPAGELRHPVIKGWSVEE